MEASVLLWEKWHEQVKQLFGGMHGHQKKTLALVVLGIILGTGFHTKEQECKCSEAQSVRDHFFSITKVRNAL